MINFCTLFDSNYLDKVLALYHSLMTVKTDFKLYAQCMDDISADILNKMNLDRMVISYPEEFEDEILKKLKKERSKAEYCWTCTAASIEYFMKKYNLIECTYIDADLYFFENPECLFKEIHDVQADISIIEHRFSIETEETQRSGRYCVEFNYFNNSENAMKALKWWKESCFEWCYHKYEPAKDGKPERYGDQKYLEQFPVLFENVHILKHLGAGVAPWNLSQYKLADNSGNKILLRHLKKRQDTALVFYHFQNLKYISHRYVNINSQSKRKELKNAIYIPYLGILEEERSMLEKEYDFRLAIRKSYSSNKIKAFIQRYVMPYRIRDISDVVDLSKVRSNADIVLGQKDRSMKRNRKFLFICLGSPFTPTMYYKENYYIKAALEEGFKVYVLANQQTYSNGKLSKLPSGIDKNYGYQLKRVVLHNVINEYFTYKIRKYDRLLEVIQKLQPDYIYFNVPQIEGVKHCKEIKDALPKVKIYLGFSTIYRNSGLNFISKNILHKMIYRYWLQRAMPYVDKVIYICKEGKRYLEEIYHIREKLVFMTLPAHVIGEDEREIIGRRIKSQYGIGDNEVVFCHSGKMDNIKKSLDLLRIFNSVPYSNFRLFIVGSFSDDIKQEAMEIINRDKRIIFTSFVPAEKLTEILCATDVYLQPASVSQTAETAICCGCTIVFEDNEVNPEIFAGNGYMIKNVSELSDIFNEIYEGRANIKKFRQISYEFAERYMEYRTQFRRMIGS